MVLDEIEEKDLLVKSSDDVLRVAKSFFDEIISELERGNEDYARTEREFLYCNGMKSYIRDSWLEFEARRDWIDIYETLIKSAIKYAERYLVFDLEEHEDSVRELQGFLLKELEFGEFLVCAFRVMDEKVVIDETEDGEDVFLSEDDLVKRFSLKDKSSFGELKDFFEFAALLMELNMSFCWKLG